MKYRKLVDATLVAALLLAYVPELTETMLPSANPVALIAPAPDTPDQADTPENTAFGL